MGHESLRNFDRYMQECSRTHFLKMHLLAQTMHPMHRTYFCKAVRPSSRAGLRKKLGTENALNPAHFRAHAVRATLFTEQLVPLAK